jgi:16S rRNA G966 N2-methylase RsmD
MNFLWLHDPLLRILYENDGIVAIDKPYGISSHTNDAKAGNEDYMIPGLIEIFERQLRQKLFIVHRLDQTTTGVFVIAKTAEAAKEYQDYFRNRETRKTYVFVTASRSKQSKFETTTPIRHKGADLAASTKFLRLNNGAKFELWQAKPATGRNHQIRIHGAEVGLPLLGDEKYGGARYPFLTLHHQKIEFPNGVSIESTMPQAFSDLALLEKRELAVIAHERDRRDRLFSGARTLRLMNVDGVTIDRLGEVEIWSGLNLNPKAEHFVGHDSKSKTKVVRDVPETWQVSEGEIRYELRRAMAPPTHGLALEHRLTRRWVREEAKGLSVLSLFSATGGFALAAKLGGASEVTAVDANKGALNWSRRNVELNELEPTSIQFLCRDALTFLNQCRTKGMKFDLILADPPNFARTEAGLFRIEEQLAPLLAGCFDALQPGGRVLFATASETLSFETIEKAIRQKQPRAKISIVQAPFDFGLPGEKTRLKTFLVETLVDQKTSRGLIVKSSSNETL